MRVLAATPAVSVSYFEEECCGYTGRSTMRACSDPVISLGYPFCRSIAEFKTQVDAEI
jgi:hypothetical protein